MGILSDDKSGDDKTVDPLANDTIASAVGNDVLVGEGSGEGLELPRDERMDSIDPQSGQLTAEAVELRRATSED